jgi:hypothetical protein
MILDTGTRPDSPPPSQRRLERRAAQQSALSQLSFRHSFRRHPLNPRVRLTLYRVPSSLSDSRVFPDQLLAVHAVHEGPRWETVSIRASRATARKGRGGHCSFSGESA